MLRALVYIVPIALLIYALIDFSRSLPSERADIPTPAWVLMIVLLPVVGPLAWILVSRSRRSGDQVHTAPARPVPGGHPASRPAPPRPAPPRRRPATRAPDDDPEFLWRLERQQRRERRNRRTDPPDPGGTAGDQGTDRRRTDDAGPDESA